MISIINEKDCCACRACEQVCPTKSIRMEENKKGFFFPKVDVDLCVNCGLCDKVCPLQESKSVRSDTNNDLYIAINKDDAVRAQSTSGGMFTILSDYVLDKGGAVYGAVFNKNMDVCHERAVTREERDRQRSSKYVQSSTGNTYRLAKNDLDAGMIVMYTGTPCQVAGLKKFLRKDYENLITVDLVCHGVPNSKMWHEFLNIAEKTTGYKVIDANFRDKSEGGWHRPKTKLEYDSKSKKVFYAEQTFFELFNDNLILRDSCLHCHFISYERPGDFTLGDYWGIERFCKEMDDNKGTSLLLVNTPKGRKIFDEVKDKANYRLSDKEHCYLGRLSGRSFIHPKTEQFWKEYLDKGFEYVWKKYTLYSPSKTFRFKVKRRLKMIFNKK